METELLSKYWFLYSILTVIGIAVGIFSYRQSFPPLGRIQRVTLAVIRGIIIVILGLFLIEPVINIHSEKSFEPGLAILTDNSGSMEIAADGMRRIDIADSLKLGVLQHMQIESHEFLFSDSLRRVEGDGPGFENGGDATSIAGALESLGSSDGFEDMGAALLITDGRQNLGEDPVSVAMKLNIPVYTLTVGEAVEERNISLDEISSPAVVYSGDEYTLKARIRAAGIEAATSTILLKHGGRAVADRKFDMPREGRMTEVELKLIAPEPGEYEYVVSVPTVEGEIESADNERSFVIRVLKDKVRILLGTASLNWEYTFIKQALSRYDDFEVTAVYPEGRGRFSSALSGGEESLTEYDVFVLVNSHSSEIRLPVSNLKKAVAAGASLIYVAGVDCLSDIRQFDDLLPLDPGRPELIKGEFFFEVSPTFRQHAAVQLDQNPDLSVKLWNSLPPFDRAISGVRPTGEVLLEARSRLSGGQQSLPVLTVKKYGDGRAAAITGFPLWRSYFESSRDEAVAESIPKFWGNLVRWMSETERTENFRVSTDRRVYRLGEPVRMTARLYDEAGRPRSGALVTASVSTRDKGVPEREASLSQSGDGTYIGTISSLPPGSYTFTSHAVSYGDTLGSVSGEFRIEKSSLEMLFRAPDYDLTQRISEATGGVAYTEDDFQNFADDLQLKTYVRESHARIKPFGTTVFLLIVLAGLAAEWGLRKRFKLP